MTSPVTTTPLLSRLSTRSRSEPSAVSRIVSTVSSRGDGLTDDLSARSVAGMGPCRGPHRQCPSCQARDEVVGRPGAAQRERIAVWRQALRRFPGGGLEAREPGGCDEEGRVEDEASAHFSRIRRPAPRVVRERRQPLVRGLDTAAPLLERVTHGLLLLLLQEQKAG